MRLGISPERLLDALADAAPALQTFYTPNCCLDATALACEIATEWGIKCKPTLTTVGAFNKSYLAGSREIGEAAVLLIDHESTDDGAIAGHLVCTGKVGSNKFLLDLSAPQFHRPAKGIFVDSGVFMEGRDLFRTRVRLRGGTTWRVCGSLPDGAAIVYESHPEPERVPWQEVPAWTAPMPEHKRARAAAKAMLLQEVELILR